MVHSYRQIFAISRYLFEIFVKFEKKKKEKTLQTGLQREIFMNRSHKPHKIFSQANKSWLTVKLQQFHSLKRKNPKVFIVCWQEVLLHST